MLEEAEYAEVMIHYRESLMMAKEFREYTGYSLKDTPLSEIFQTVREKYEQITGMKNCHHEAILHHRISLYGAPCEKCQKPLRTPKARLCGSCMAPVE